jgi:hypothetical protein
MILRLLCIWFVFIHCCHRWCMEPWTWYLTQICLILFLLSTPATCFGLLSGHHQALCYTIQLYIYLLLLLTSIHYNCLYIGMVTDTPCTVVFRVLVSSHMCVLWFLFPVWGFIQLVSPVRCVLIWFGRGCSCPVLLVGLVVASPVGLSLHAVLLVALSPDVINPCYPRCVGTLVALWYYWLLCVSRHCLDTHSILTPLSYSNTSTTIKAPSNIKQKRKPKRMANWVVNDPQSGSH